MATVPGEDSRAVEREFIRFVLETTSVDPWLKDHPPEIAFVGYFAEPSEIPTDSPVVESLLRSFRKVNGADPVISGREGAADTRHLNRYAETPTVIFGPGKSEQMHANNEWVAVDDLVSATKVLAATILDWCGYVSS